MAEVTFLFDNQLIYEVELLIKKSEHKLLLISPYIDLDARIQDALQAKLNKKNFKLEVLFGKNEHNIYKSIKKNSLDFLKQFPNVEIRYNERLHAKFYQNDFDFIMTSLNLYDYSLANNIEVGVKNNFAAKGLIKRLFRSIERFFEMLFSKLDHSVFGNDDEIDPIDKFKIIFENSELKYRTKPILEKKSGIQGFFGGTEVKGKTIQTDELSNSPNKSDNRKSKDSTIKKPTTENQVLEKMKTSSASKLAKALGVSTNEITSTMEKAGYIDNDNNNTPYGSSNGLTEKKYMGKTYIAYPENIKEIKELSNKNK